MNRNIKPSSDRRFRFSYNQKGRMVRPIFPIFVSINGSSEKIKANALLDTGSNKSCVVKEFVKCLGLYPIKKGTIIQDSTKRSSIYLLDFIFTENIIYRNIEVMAIQKQPTELGNFDVLIGMDIIRTGDLIIKSAFGNTVIFFDVMESENKDGVF